MVFRRETERERWGCIIFAFSVKSGDERKRGSLYILNVTHVIDLFTNSNTKGPPLLIQRHLR